MGRLNRYIWFLLMIIIGAGIGLYYSWFIKPPDFVDAVFTNLRQDYKSDYILMVAEIYDMDHNRLEANHRLDAILDQNETKEWLIQNAIKNAEGLGYDPVDLRKMNQLFEVVTGLKPTATPQTDPTMVFNFQQTSTAVAITLNTANGNQAGDNTGADTAPSGSSGADPSVPQADADPFGTGIQITTDPNALPELDLPSVPTITPNPAFSSGSSQNSADPSDEPEVFGGLPDSFFDGR